MNKVYADVLACDGMGRTGCDLRTDPISDRDRRDRQQIFYAESCPDDYSSDTNLCGTLAWKGPAKSQKESVLKNKVWFAILN